MLHRFRVDGPDRQVQGLTVRLIAEGIRQGALDPTVRRAAAELLTRHDQHDELAQLAELHAFVRDQIAWVGDPDETEWIQRPARTLAEGFGDCDDKAALCGALARSVGFPVAVVAVGPFADGPWAHVFPAVRLGGRWIAAEVSEQLELGEELPAARRDLLPVTDGTDPEAARLWDRARLGQSGGAEDILEAGGAGSTRTLTLVAAAGGAALGFSTAPAGERAWRSFVGAFIATGLARSLAAATE